MQNDLSAQLSRTAEPHPPRPTRCVLVVEDDDAVREVIEHLLRADGWDPLLADSATTGELTFLKYRHRIGLILTDIVMPDRNGYWLAGRIRSACPDVPILGLSGYREVAEHAVDYFLRFLSKPFKPADLLAAVRDCYRAPSAATRAEPAA